MRTLFVSALALALPAAVAAQTPAPCTGLCLQQVSCPPGQSTTVSGKVFAPNGNDPLPNVTVYIPNAPVDAFTAGVSCPVVGAAPSGSPLVGGVTTVDGSFKLENVPVGANIPVVIQTGRWRRQLTIPSTTACTDTAFSANMPKNHNEGDIPKIAIATGSADSVECVLRKVGIDDAEFTDPSGTGRINLYTGTTSAGARISASTPTEAVLMNTPANIKAYDVLMLPCQGSGVTRSSTQLANFLDFANSGGRVYSSHFSYVWMNSNGPMSSVVNWGPTGNTLNTGTATINQGFAEGKTLAQWLQIVGASTTLGQMDVSTIKHDFNGVNAPTKSWMSLDFPSLGSQVMQFTFDAPIGGTNQCGRVLFNEYHVENPTIASSGKIFPAECPATTVLTPQEKLLEYSLFSLTSDGGQPTLDPATGDFGNQPISTQSATKIFSWTNNSSFAASVSSATVTGPFVVTSNTCMKVPAGATCQIGVAFKPTAIGAATGVVTVDSTSKTLTADVTGRGIPGFTAFPATLTFGSVDIGAISSPQNITLTNSASVPLPAPPVTASGDFTAVSNCPAVVPGNASCTVSITFRPVATGARAGTFGSSSSDPLYTGLSSNLTGNGIDFSISVTPNASSVVAGRGLITVATVTPIAGFANAVTVVCNTSAPGSTCVPSATSFVASTPITNNINITTTSKYAVIGYGGLGAGRWLWMVAGVAGLLLMWRRKKLGSLAKVTLAIVLLSATCGSLTGCSGKLPAQNANYTAPGSYTYTITATDGFLTRSATFTLVVTVQ